MLRWLRLHDRTVKVLGKDVLVQVHHQKKLIEGLPTIGGFLFDVLTLHRADEVYSMIHQSVFLVLIFLLLYLENLPREKVENYKLWKLYDYSLQFLFGGLLSGYTIFYFKSASTIPVIMFALILFALMLLNESITFHRLKFPVRYFLASLCLCSFLVYLLPIIFHWMNWVSFLLSAAASFFIYIWYIDTIHKKQTWKEQPKRQRAIWGGLVPIVFTILYFLKLIPPVPLSCEELGIYHDIHRVGDNYELSYTRPSWKFWQHGDQTFLYRDGDRVFVFTSVFAPTDLKHQISIRWEKKDPRTGWQTTDIIPMDIRGGRERGFRGVAFKQSVSEGQWRVRIQTAEGRELRRLQFEVVNDPDSSERDVKIKKS